MSQIIHHECRHMQHVSATERLYVHCCPSNLLQISAPTKPLALITMYENHRYSALADPKEGSTTLIPNFRAYLQSKQR